MTTAHIILLLVTGVGGGIVTIPVMTLALKFKIHNAIAASLAIWVSSQARH